MGEGQGLSGSGIFWIINGSVYGLLQVPREYVLCSEVSCDLQALRIPVSRREMDGYTFQCVAIDYSDGTQYLGGVTELEVITLQGYSNGTMITLYEQVSSLTFMF